MQTPNDILTVSYVIQQAVAPVFLLTGVGAILGVLSTRLARAIDHFRTLDKSADEERIKHKAEMALLLQRSRWIHWAITLCTLSALLVCIVIAALFIGSELNMDPSGTVALLFITSMLSLTAGLLCFLREIALATGSIKIREETLL